MSITLGLLVRVYGKGEASAIAVFQRAYWKVLHIHSEIRSFVNVFLFLRGRPILSLRKKERKEASLHILIPREFEVAEMGISTVGIGRTGGFMENV